MCMNKNFVSSIFMVSGGSMGAGFLALPLVAAGANFIFSACMLVLMAIFSYYLAIYSLEIYIVFKGGVNTLSIAKKSFGNVGAAFSAIINCLLLYTLLMIYIMGGGDLFKKTIFPLIGMKSSSMMGIVIFLVVFMPIFLFGYRAVTKSNEFIFGVKLISFLTTIVIGVYFLANNIFEFDIKQAKYIFAAIPVYCGALAFQMVVPVIAKINHYDRQQCKKIFVIGIAIPVVLYIFWIAILLSLIPRVGSGHTFETLLLHKESVGTMIAYAINQGVRIPIIMKLGIGLFSNIAILTSFLVLGLSLYEYLRDAFHISQHFLGRILTLILTMTVPIIFAIVFPKGFIFMYRQAMILLLISFMFPLASCLKEYDKLEVKLPKFNLWLLLVVCMLIIVIQILDNMRLLPVFPFN